MVGVAVEVLDHALHTGFDLRGVVQEGAPGTLNELSPFNNFIVGAFCFREERKGGGEVEG